MLKKILALVAMLSAAVCFAAVDVNNAGAADLDSIKGIGPAMSSKIIDERKKGNFKDWNDFTTRVKGVGEKSAAKFSNEGLTVSGATYKGVTASPSANKTAVKANTKPTTTATPAVAAPVANEVKKDTKAEPAKPAASAAKK